MVCELFQREQPRARFLSIGFDFKLEVTGSFTCCTDMAHNQAIDLLTLANMPVTSNSKATIKGIQTLMWL